MCQQDFTTADQYERQLLTEVIPPEEINVSFDDIGALETVKTVLQEVSVIIMVAGRVKMGCRVRSFEGWMQVVLCLLPDVLSQ